MKLDLTKCVPERGFLQYGTLYNKEVSRTETELIVERCEHNATPWITRYEKRSLFGLIHYWKFSGWWIKECGDN